MNKNLKLFLEELAILTEKYDIEIGGCKCCGSPYLDQRFDEKLLTHFDLDWNKHSKEYNVDKSEIKF